IELCKAQPSTSIPGINLPRLYVSAIDALDASGNGEHAGLVAEEAYHQFAEYPDRGAAALISSRAAFYRGIEAPDTGLPLIQEALRLFEEIPPSADHAEAWLHYANIFLLHTEGKAEISHAALSRALEIAEAASATVLIPRILSGLAVHAFVRGQVEEGFAI